MVWATRQIYIFSSRWYSFTRHYNLVLNIWLGMNRYAKMYQNLNVSDNFSPDSWALHEKISCLPITIFWFWHCYLFRNIFLCRKGWFALQGPVIQQWTSGSKAALLQRVWQLIMLWLCVSWACQLLRPHEVQEHRGMSGDIAGVTTVHFSYRDSNQTCHLNLTSRHPLPIPLHMPLGSLQTHHGQEVHTLITWHITLWGTVSRGRQCLGAVHQWQ